MKSNYNRVIFSWSLYDFANQPFTTIIVTFIYSSFFVNVIAENEILGTVLWSRAITISAIFVAFVSPILGAISDKGGYRKIFLIFWTCMCIIFTLLLFLPKQGQVFLALTYFVISNISFEMGSVFCNSFLPFISPKSKIGRISGYGWSLGYLGGLLSLFLSFFLFINTENPAFGFSMEQGENIRAINLLVGIWYGIFSIPAILWIKAEKKSSKLTFKMIKNSYLQVVNTFKEMQNYHQLLRFLIARMFYNDGLITIFAFGGIYAAGTFGFTINEIFLFGIILNIFAGLGAFSFGFLDDFLGSRKTIMISLIGLIVACLIAIITTNKNIFWLSGILIGIFSGPNQSSSRALMSRLIPIGKEDEFFGFYAFSGKATAFLGPFLLGFLTQIFDSQRIGICIVILLMIIGLILLKSLSLKPQTKSK